MNIELHDALVPRFIEWLDREVNAVLSPAIPAGDGTSFHVVTPRLSEQPQRQYVVTYEEPCGDWPAPCNCDGPHGWKVAAFRHELAADRLVEECEKQDRQAFVRVL